jgi:hypothetical protein
MGCGCGKKAAESAAVVASTIIHSMETTEWGPVFWKVLHCFSIRVGFIGDRLIDTDQARSMELLIGLLGDVLPCETCQRHFKEWIGGHSLGFVGTYGSQLRCAIELWLLNFHNAVRGRLGASIEVNTVAEYEALYKGCKIEKCEIDMLGRAAKYAIDRNIIKPSTWKRWFTEFKKLKVMLGA